MICCLFLFVTAWTQRSDFLKEKETFVNTDVNNILSLYYQIELITTRNYLHIMWYFIAWRRRALLKPNDFISFTSKYCLKRTLGGRRHPCWWRNYKYDSRIIRITQFNGVFFVSVWFSTRNKRLIKADHTDMHNYILLWYY